MLTYHYSYRLIKKIENSLKLSIQICLFKAENSLIENKSQYFTFEIT